MTRVPRSALVVLALGLLAPSARADGPPSEAPKTELRVSGYAQVDWVLSQQSSLDEVDHATEKPLNQERILLRRGHVRLDAERGLLTGVFELDANTLRGAEVRPVDVQVGIRWPERPRDDGLALSASAGLMKIPFGYEIPESDAVRPFLERGTAARALFPGERDLGVRITARYRFVDLVVAAMNGEPLGDRTFPALDANHQKDIVGRLGAAFAVVPGVDAAFGMSADGGSGFHSGTPTTKDVLVWRDDNGDGIVQATEIQVLPGNSATPSETFPRFALGADARLSVKVPVLGRAELRAELVRAQNLDRGLEPADPVGAGYDLREFGYQLGFTQELTRWGMIGIRYDRYDPDQDAHEQRAAEVVAIDRSYSTLALLAILRYDTARLSVEYDHNGNALGRSANGSPTTLASDAVTARVQVSF